CRQLLQRLVALADSLRDISFLTGSRGTTTPSGLCPIAPQCLRALRFSRFAACFIAPPHCLPRGSGQGIVATQTCTGKGPAHVRFGSKADICAATSHVRFTPNSDRESEFPQRAM